MMIRAPSNDGRFAGDTRDRWFALWLAQNQSTRGGQWIGAGAAGALGEACASLCRSEAVRWRICQGYMGPGWNMYYSVSVHGTPEVRRPTDSQWLSRAEAARDRRVIEKHFLDQWIRGGGPSGVQDWCFPFLEPEEPT